MVYIGILIIILFFNFFGIALVEHLQLKKMRNPLIYGFFIYISGFFILSGPMVFLHLSWNIYFNVMAVYTFLVLLYILWIWYSYKIFSRRINMKKVLKEKWPLYVVIIIVVFVYLASTASFFLNWSYVPASVDDYIYLSYAAKSIGASEIYRNSTVVLSEVMGSTSLVAYWELFWAYGSTVLHIPLLDFVHTSLAIVMLTLLPVSIDEVSHLANDWFIPQKIKKYFVFSVLVFYIFGNMQYEFAKYMFLPWFGNVFSTALYIPLLLVFFLQALKHKQMLPVFLSFPIIAIGFSPVSIITTIFLFPVALFFFLRYKTYAIKYQKMLVISCTLLIIGFSALAIVTFSGSDLHKFLILYKETDSTMLAEKFLFSASFKGRVVLILFASAIFLLKYYVVKMQKSEIILLCYVAIIMLLSILPIISNIPFNLFSFPYRRFIESITVFYIIYGLGSSIYFIKKRQFLVFLTIILLIPLTLNGLLIKEWRPFFSPKLITNSTRVHPLTLELAYYFKNIPMIKQVCFLQDELKYGSFSYDGEIKIDFTTALFAVDPQVYLKPCNLTRGTDVTHIVVFAKDSRRVEEEVNYKNRKTIENEKMKLYVYEI